MNCAIPRARSPLRVRGPITSGRSRLSCQIRRVKNSTGSPFARAALLTRRQIDSSEADELGSVAPCGAETLSKGSPRSRGSFAVSSCAEVAAASNVRRRARQSRVTKGTDFPLHLPLLFHQNHGLAYRDNVSFSQGNTRAARLFVSNCVLMTTN